MSPSQLSTCQPSTAPDLEHCGFELVYQPVYRVQGQIRQVVAFESLLRVCDQGPAEVVARAEADGSIVGIDRWVLSQVVALMRTRPKLSVWVNTSQRSIADPTFVDDALRLLADNRALGRVSLEITETADVDADLLAARLEKLKLQALTVMIDDVRDGFAKRSLLSSAAVIGCKLSRETTKELMASPMARREVTKLIEQCANQGKQVVLEGIETPAELALASELRISLCQGYLLGIPDKLAHLAHHEEMLTA